MSAGADRGSAVVDFVLVSVLLVVLVLGVMQVAFALYVRNSVGAAAAEGARYAANADRGVDDGVARTREVIAASVGSRYSGDVVGGTEVVDGFDVVVIEVSAPLPVLGPLGPSRTITARGRAVVEAAP